MSVKAAAEFMAKLTRDETLKARVDAAVANATDVLAAFSEVARREGFDVQPEDLAWVPKGSELDERELDRVAGGVLLTVASSTSASGDIVLKGKKILEN